MPIPTKDVPCPCCGKTLFVMGALHKEPMVLGSSRLELEHDANGSFMRCPHCSKRVVFVSAPSPVGTGWRVGDTQPCADCR